jgi:hypothetical protein
MANNLGHGAPQAAQRAPHPAAPHRQAQHPQAPQPQAPQPQGPQTPHPQAQRMQPQEPLGLDPGAWPVIRQSAARLSRNQDAFIQQLHYDVTSLIPEMPGAPALDMWVFCERMTQALLWVALTDQPLSVVAETLRRVGGQNWVEGFPDAQYVSVAHALVQTVHYLSGNDWSPSMGSVWISYFMWIRPHLIAGAQQAAAQYAAERQEAERQAAAQRALAEREAARVKALSRNSGVVGDVNLESVASLLVEDEDDEDVGYGQIMLSMTRNPRRDPPRHTSLTGSAH